MESGRRGNRRIDGAFLSEDVEGENEAGGGVARGAGRDVAAAALAVAVLLGRVSTARRVAVTETNDECEVMSDQ